MIGIDYASVDRNAPPDFQAAKRAGARFVIPRGAYGRRTQGQVGNSPIYLDPVWARDKDRIKAAGLRRSSYLFLCVPRKGLTTPEPDEQVAEFLSYVQLERATPLYCGDYVPCIDVEEESDVLTSDQYFDWIVRAVAEATSTLHAFPAIYFSNRVWTEYLKKHAAGVLKNCPLWIAKPWPWPIRTQIHLDGAAGYSPTTVPQFGDSTNWLWYQYQGDAIKMPGFSSTVDGNRCQVVSKGSQGDIVKWIQARVGTSVDGDFGPDTKLRVQAFQNQYRLTADGIVGIDTFAPLTWTPVKE